MFDHGESIEVLEPHEPKTNMRPLSVGTLDETDLIRTVEILAAALLDSFGVVNGAHCDRCREVQERTLPALRLAGF